MDGSSVLASGWIGNSFDQMLARLEELPGAHSGIVPSG